MNEFDLIKKYFNFTSKHALLGIGDDAALIPLNKNELMAISMDTLNIGHHFTDDSDPYYLGWKSLAVNISDIVSMGGQPRYALLSISLKNLDVNWIGKFTKGIKACAKKYSIEIIGGDTNKGSTSISIAIMGNVSSKNVLKRSGAIPEDEIWVTNEVGYAALHFNQHSLLPKHKKSISNCLKKRSQEEFLKPQPPLEFIQETKSMINSAIDLSDGLVGDLKHILKSSSVGAKIEINKIPMHKWFKENHQYELAICGGEDYQILMTASDKHHNKIQNLLKKHSLKGAMIGKITKDKKIEYSFYGKKIKLSMEGFTHFG